MFETAELNQSLSAQRYDAELPALRAKLLQAHFDLRTRKFPVLVIVSGADGAGKGELVHRLNEWLDPRGVETHAFWATSDEERERPPYWRFWRALPGRGRIGIFFGSWYTAPIIRRVFRETKLRQLDVALDRIVALEQMLADDGAEMVKFWLHLPKQAQKKRLKKLEAEGRIAPDDWKHFKLYDRFTKVSERALRHTDTGAAPWHVIEATDRRGLYADLAQAVSETGTDIRSLELKSVDTRVSGAALVEVENLQHLDKIMKAVRRVKGVSEVARRDRLTSE